MLTVCLLSRDCFHTPPGQSCVVATEAICPTKPKRANIGPFTKMFANHFYNLPFYLWKNTSYLTVCDSFAEMRIGPDIRGEPISSPLPWLQGLFVTSAVAAINKDHSRNIWDRRGISTGIWCKVWAIRCHLPATLMTMAVIFTKE